MSSDENKTGGLDGACADTTRIRAAGTCDACRCRRGGSVAVRADVGGAISVTVDDTQEKDRRERGERDLTRSSGKPKKT